MSVASTELLRAAVSGDLNSLRALLDQGADVNSKNKANQTALMLAVAFKRLEVVEYLVLAGADVKAADDLGLTAIDWARQDIRITRLLAAPRASVVQKEPVVQPTHEETAEEMLTRVRHPMSPAIRTLVRVSIVVVLIAGGFGVYHFLSLLLTTRTTSVKPESVSIPSNAATNRTKPAPVVDGPLAGTELFLPDARYPPNATVRSGKVTVGIQVTSKGVVVNVETFDGDESLRSAAETAAWSSAFAPEKLVDKDPVIDGTITYSFWKSNDSKPEFVAISDVTEGSSVSASVGGPLSGAERKLVIPKIPKWVTVGQESATVVVRVNKSGRVMSYRPLDAEERLRTYLIKAARASTFDPAKLPTDGQVVGIITYKFQ